MILVTRIDYSVEEGIYSTPVGYVETMLDYVNFLNTKKAEATYRGLDGNDYPLYKSKTIEKLI